MRYLHVLLVAVLGGLAACGGGGGGGGSGVDPRLARLDVYEAQRLRVLGDASAGVVGLAPTPAVAVPPIGQVAFSGAGTIMIFQPAETLALYGDANLTLDLAANTAQGTLSRVFGQSLAGGVADYSGTLNLAGTQTDAAVQLSYSGLLSDGPNSFGFDGTLNGLLLGDPIGGFVATDLAAAINQSGTPREGTVVLFGEGTVSPPSSGP